MTPLEREIVELRDAIRQLPDSTEKEIAARAARHSFTLIDRSLDTAVEAFERAQRFYKQAQKETRQ